MQSSYRQRDKNGGRGELDIASQDVSGVYLVLLDLRFEEASSTKELRGSQLFSTSARGLRRAAWHYYCSACAAVQATALAGPINPSHLQQLQAHCHLSHSGVVVEWGQWLPRVGCR